MQVPQCILKCVVSVVKVFSEPDQEVQERKIELYVGLMCAIGGVSFFTFLIQVSVVPKEKSKTSDLN